MYVTVTCHKILQSTIYEIILHNILYTFYRAILYIHLMESSKDLTNTAYEFVEYQNVRISPPRIYFLEGTTKKKMKSKFTLQNVGKSQAFIRICKPKFKDYVIDCFPRGKYLSPGLKISNTVTIEYTSDTPSECLLPIYINEEKYEYSIMIKPEAASFTITPKFLDFGFVNAGNIHMAHRLILENKGPKDQLYQVDRGLCDESIVLEPVRGHVKSRGATSITVRPMSFEEKRIDTKIFVKCGHVVFPVPIKAHIIVPRLEAIHPNAAEHFTLLEFPKTYFGLKSVVNLFVRNYSAAAQMFSTTGEIHHKRNSLDRLKKDSINFKFFGVYPTDGMFQEDETKLFQFMFEPKEIDLVTKFIPFYFCTIVIHRFQYGTLNMRGNFFDELSASFFDSTSMSSCSNRQSLSISLDGPLKCYNVTCEIRVIEVTNQSVDLPIYLRYKKIPFVHLDHEQILLQPSQRLQLAVNIIPCKLGNVDTEIVFHLLFHDYPATLDSTLKVIGEIAVPLCFDVVTETQYPKHQLNFGLTPNYIREVGRYCQRIRFNTKIHKAKAVTVHNVARIDSRCNDLVAFPNDTQRSVRPYRAFKPCKTIFTRTGRYMAPVQSEYELNTFDHCFKKEVKNYYTNYLRTQMKKNVVDNQREYNITKEGKILCADLSCTQPCSVRYKPLRRGDFFVPLTPQEMDNIIIFPPIVQTGEIATNSAFTFKVFVHNNNSYAIRIILTSDRPNLYYIDGSRHTIVGQGCSAVKISYSASYVGYYTSNLYLIINESSVLTIPIFAQVVHTRLRVDTKSIIFEKRETHKYLTMQNRLNVPITFNWLVINSNFSIEPCSGFVLAGRRINCIARYHCSVDGPSETEAQLYSGEGHAHIQKIHLSTNITHQKITKITDEIDFGYIPLNESVTSLLLIKNNDSLPLKFEVDEFSVPQTLHIRPLTGMIPALSQIGLNVTAKFLQCIKFNYKLKIAAIKAGFVEADVRGTVVYPAISVSPSYFNMPKISASMTASMKFVVKNNSVANVRVRFDMEEYDEFKISETKYPFCDASSMEEVVISGHGSTHLYIHFSPAGASSTLFYLPIVINGILGPPLYTDVISTKVEYYLTDVIEDCVYIKTPSTIPTIKVHTLVMPEKISISKKFIHFLVNGCEQSKKELEHPLVFCNMQSSPEDLCLRIEQVQHPLYIKYKSGNPIERSNCAIVFTLGPNEKTALSVSFQPDKLEFGQYRVLVPVYLRSDMSMEEHRLIIIDATYNRPLINVRVDDSLNRPVERVRFEKDYVEVIEPIPMFKNGALFIVQEMIFINHLQDCKIDEVNLDNYSIEVIPKSKTIITDDEYNIVILKKIKLKQPRAYRMNWTLSCSCGGEWQRFVNGICEDSILTTYASAPCFKDWPASPWYDTKVFHYPFYPPPTDDNFFYMNECTKAAKDWLNTQVLFGQWSYEIPDTMNFAHFEPPTPECVKRQTQLTKIPIMHVLTNLLGPQVVAYFDLRHAPSSDYEDMVVYLYRLYTKMVTLLEEHGAYFDCLQPEYLFTYRFFTQYKALLYDRGTPPYTYTEFVTEFEEFERLSKQTWLNLILQIYKCLYLEVLMAKHEKLCKIGSNSTSNSANNSANSLAHTPIAEYFAAEHQRKSDDFLSLTESKILNWLEYHFNKSKNCVWSRGSHLANVTIDLLSNCLSNGVVFAVVLATYCPYLKEYLADFYPHPESPEQVYHNITTLIKTLEMIKYTFTITPEQIIEGNPVRLLMFSVYLFEVLPFMYPTETIRLKTGLSTKTTSYIEIYNENNFPIAYKPIFIGSDVFSVNKEVFEIPPKKKLNISVIYWAKFAQEVECTLILSGEVTGYRYVTNKCVTLVGFPDLSHAVTTITHKQELFLSQHIDFDVQSPYLVAARYDMQQTYETMHQPIELLSVIYHYERDRIASARLVAINKSFDFDENGQCKINAVVSTAGQIDISMWFYFRNSQVGDFAVKFISVCKDCTRHETLTVNLPMYIEELRERPDSLFLKIPNRNNLFFNVMKSILVNLTEGDETALWERILETPIGVNILENLLSTTGTNLLGHTPRCMPAEYTIVVEESADIILPEKMKFDNECSSGFAKIPIKLKHVDHYPKSFKFTMESKVMHRKRYYYVVFNLG